MSETRNSVWLLDDQLSPHAASLAHAPAISPPPVVLMIESRQGGGFMNFHKHSLVLGYAALRHRAAELTQAGYQVDYYPLSAPEKNFQQALTAHVRRNRIQILRVMQPSDYGMSRALPRLARNAGVALEWIPTNQFLTSRGEFRDWAGDQKHLLMETHYRRMRRKLGVLVDAKGKPEGGRWNFDGENRLGRREYDRQNQDLFNRLPPRPVFGPDEITREVMREVDRYFPGHPGNTGDFWLPVTRAQALVWCDHFISHHLAGFGPFEDLMLRDDPFVHHSILSPLLNIGLLEPLELAEKAVAAYEAGRVPLNSVEGFVRQIIGWREFVNGIYWLKMPGYRENNALGATRPLPGFFHTGRTEMNCLRTVLGQVRRFGYAHHIQRLMVLGNFMLLAGIDPKQAHRWFVEMFVDGYDWVMAANVFGMVLHADGGLMATKPYAASAAYIDRMSDYCQGCRFSPKIKTGPGACPYNLLYWNFFARHAERFAKNPRVSVMISTWRKKPAGEQAQILEEARTFLDSLS
ncbi:MAG: cryptochrome/photolyase family protein [Verrucomicrobiae bacterium]|nr:cryptochrome/photolyase family protein [Verrucomicrobiae bacterium]